MYARFTNPQLKEKYQLMTVEARLERDRQRAMWALNRPTPRRSQIIDRIQRINDELAVIDRRIAELSELA